MSESLIDMLISHEGMRLKPYTDQMGKLTIGIGRNLTDNGITSEEAMAMMAHDIDRCRNECLHAFPWFADLDEGRQNVILNMCFNMGLSRLMKFKRMLTAIELGNYALAGVEMMESAWAQQVPKRALELATIMRGES